MHEVFTDERAAARESVRLDAVPHDSAEQLTAHSEPLAPPAHSAGRLALERRRVDGSLTGDDDRRVTSTLVEADQVEHELGAGEQLASERRERGAEPAPRARSRQIPVESQLRHRGESRLELLDHLSVGSLLRAEDARGAALAEQRIANVAGDAHRHTF